MRSPEAEINYNSQRYVSACRKGCGRIATNRPQICKECSYRTCKCGKRYLPYKDRPLCKDCWNWLQQKADTYS